MKPNIIVFMTDHQRGDTILQGSPVRTPNLDAFRRQSVTFTEAYCPAPHCCPSRATFFTGLYPSEHGVWNNVNVGNTLSRGLYENVRVFTEDLVQNGYRAYLSGKWHVSDEQGPEEFGLELLYHHNRYRKRRHVPDRDEWNWYRNGGAVDKGGEKRGDGQIIRPGYTEYCQYGTDENPFRDSDVADAAVDKLRELAGGENPFFMFVGPLGPHDPYFVPQAFLDLYPPETIELPESFYDEMEDKPALYRRTRDRFARLTPAEHRESIRHFYAFCSYEDALFGRVLRQVRESGLAENTVVMYLSDHGDYIGAHGLWTKGLPCFREAYHICSMIGGYGVEHPDRTEDALLSLADFAPTILELAGADPQREFSGRSLLPFLRGQKPVNWRTECYSQTNGNEVYGIQRAVWDKKWKYVFNTFDYDELYDLENDPREMRNLLYGVRDYERCAYTPLLKEECAKLWRFAYEHQDNCVNPYIMTAFAPFGPGIIFDKNSQT